MANDRMDKESSKVLSFERGKGCLCIPIGCNSLSTFVLAYRITGTTVVKQQYFTAFFVKIPSL